MAEVLVQFAEPVRSVDRKVYRAQAVGEEMPDGLWEAWIEFIPLTGGAPIRSPRETTQSNGPETTYWASGLSATYLEGALARALKKPVVTITPPPAPIFEKSAREAITSEPPESHVNAVLDPFSVYEKGEALLRKELGALAAWHLVNIIVAYELSEESKAVLNQLPRGALIDLIVAGVREQTLTR